MRALVILGCALLANACVSVPSPEPSLVLEGLTPSVTVVDRIEALLAEDPCVASLDRWARHYKLRRVPDGLNGDVVDIDLRQAGVFGYRAGRYVIPQTDPATGVGDMMITADDR